MGTRALDEREMLELAITHIAFLTPVSLVVAVPGVKAVVIWTSSLARYRGAPAKGEAAFSPLEFEALARAYESDRYQTADLTTFAIRKLREPTWRVTQPIASNGLVMRGDPWAPAWYAGHEGLGVHAHEMRHGVTVGRLLVAYGARLVRVEEEAA